MSDTLRVADGGRAPGAGAPVVRVLGAVSVRRSGADEQVAGRRLRTVLAALAVAPDRYRSASGLIDDVWGDGPPRDPANALHTQMSRLRALLPENAVDHGPAGYRLALGPGAVDLSVARGRIGAAERMARSGSPGAALAALDEASALWRGQAGGDLPGSPARDALRTESEALLRRAGRARIDALMAAGDHEAALPLLRAACEADPIDEPAHAMLMRALAGAGRANEALTLYEEVRGRLADGLGADPSEELRAVHGAVLRGENPQPEQARPGAGPPGSGRSGADRASSGAPGADGHAPRSIGLRAEPNPLIGRSADAAALRRLLGSSRVVTILGPGGTGKTRLAHHVGNAEAAARPVVMVELVGVRSGEDVATVVAGALGLGVGEVRPDRILAAAGREPQGREDPRMRLRAALGTHPTLLILDNCEQVIDECADLVSDLVASCPPLTIVTTSRTPLMIAAESVYPLAPLDVDGPGGPAAELFTDRARAVRPSVHLDPEAVARLCAALDGLPLAIELAAARVRTMSVERIGELLADRFALLRSGDRTAPERHRTLHAVIEWSWNLLGDDERTALRRLSHLPGGFCADAARAVAGESSRGPGPAGRVDDALAGLVDQSLVQVTESPGPVGVRYRMLETVREYGLRRLAADPEEQRAVAERFGAWAAGFSTRTALRLVRGVTADQVAVVEAEQENLVAALRRALADPQPTVALPVLVVLGGFWTMRGAHSEAGSWAGRVQEHLEAPGGDPGALPAWTLDTAVDTDVMHMAVLLITAHYFFLSPDRRAMARWRTAARRLLRRRPPVNGRVDLIVRVLVQASPSGLGRILARGVRSEDPTVRGLSYAMRANAHDNSGRRFAARRDGEAALRLARSTGDRWSEGMAAQMLGQLAGQSGRYDEAVGQYRLAAQVLWEVGAFEESIQTRGFIAAALVGAGRTDAGRREARGALDAGEGIVAASGNPRPTSQYRAALAAALAEADLAEGAVDAGLGRYRAAIGDAVGVHGTESAAALDPYLSLLAAAAATAHAEHGSHDDAGELSRLLLRAVVPRFTTGMSGRDGVVDLPITAAVLLALAAVDLCADRPASLPDPGSAGTGAESAGTDPESAGAGAVSAVAAWDLALARRANARQDYPSMSLDRWTHKARLLLGDEVVVAEEARAAALPRSELAAALVAALERRARRA